MTTLALSLPDRRRVLGMAVPFIAVVGSMIVGLLLIAAIYLMVTKPGA